GYVYPSVILMKGKVQDKKKQIQDFFQKELKKSRNNEENIFNYLHFFDWEGETLEEGEKILKQRYERNKNLLKDILYKNYNFYFLIKDNSKREEIFSGLKKLRKVEKNSLKDLNDFLPQFESIKEDIQLLSLKDWVKLSEYGEFLDFENITKEIKEIKEERFKDITLESVLSNPDKYEFKICKQIKGIQDRGEEIRTPQKKEKQLQREIQDKKDHLIREAILSSPKKNLINYFEKLSTKKWTLGDITEDIVFATRLHKVLEDKEEQTNKEILEQLFIQGKRPLDWKKNRDWISLMENKINTTAWLTHFSKEYTTVKSKDYESSLVESRNREITEIIEHLQEAGIEIPKETKIEKIERILSENKERIPVHLSQDIKTHISAIHSLEGTEQSKLPSKIILETEEDPLKTLQMGQKVIGSCLRIKGGSEQSAVCNAVDINKKVIWAKNEKGEVLGRVLIGINEQGELNAFRIYNNDPRINLKNVFEDFLPFLAKEFKTKLTARGEIKQLVGENWHDDGARDW
ncbi:MAG: hypothetical protein KY055_00665, partial [Candidatus Nealsonbacteria bacterium]|nr:hypothetical protein [Candidatus Nealsonbacteria bacterium]